MIKSKKIKVGVILVLLFVIADYFGCFVMLNKDGYKPIPFSFVVVDTDSNKPINDLQIERLMPDESKRRVLYELSDNGSINGHVFVGWGGIQTILFDKRTIISLETMEFNFVLSSNGYETKKMKFMYEQLNEKKIIALDPVHIE